MCSKKLHLWESALLMAFAITLLAGCWASAEQAELAGQVLRLHVVANSDSEEDQALKLQVRDAVLAQAEPVLAGAADSSGAELALTPHLTELERVAREVLAAAGCEDDVAVSVSDQWFPTRQYDGFALPAGQYRALRVVIGQGAGQNWWCVVFPPLCLAAVTEEVAEAASLGGLTEGQVELITGQDGGYVLKFKLVEWWGMLMEKLKRSAEPS